MARLTKKAAPARIQTRGPAVEDMPMLSAVDAEADLIGYRIATYKNRDEWAGALAEVGEEHREFVRRYLRAVWNIRQEKAPA